jgi:hypothetical protein
MSIEEAFDLAMAPWRGHVNEVLMIGNIRALALASHEADCFDCRLRYQDRNERGWESCPTRLRIAALGASGDGT